MRSLGLDVGDKRTGVAISDPQGILASPLTVLASKDEDAVIDEVLKLVEQYEAGCIVVGLPYSLDGNLSLQANKVTAFADKLSQRGLNIQLWDERLSTIAANRLMTEAGTKRDKRKQQRDALAAAFILQGFLDSLRDKEQCQSI
jgi:putative Holliday junction resolvase